MNTSALLRFWEHIGKRGCTINYDFGKRRMSWPQPYASTSTYFASFSRSGSFRSIFSFVVPPPCHLSPFLSFPPLCCCVYSMRRTNLIELQAGDRVNLERSMAGNGRNSGHFVQGHVDGTGEVAVSESVCVRRSFLCVGRDVCVVLLGRNLSLFNLLSLLSLLSAPLTKCRHFGQKGTLCGCEST
jgi:hypothetical protein